jgi:hypothetical protein
MSWIAYYVEVSHGQREEELARRAERAAWEPSRLPRPRRPRWRDWLPPRPRPTEAGAADRKRGPVRPAAS